MIHAFVERFCEHAGIVRAGPECRKYLDPYKWALPFHNHSPKGKTGKLAILEGVYAPIPADAMQAIENAVWDAGMTPLVAEFPTVSRLHIRIWCEHAGIIFDPNGFCGPFHIEGKEAVLCGHYAPIPMPIFRRAIKLFPTMGFSVSWERYNRGQKHRATLIEAKPCE